MSQAGIINVIENNPGIPIIFDANTGSATALFNILNIVGNTSQGVSSSASSNTVTFTVANATTASKGVAQFNPTDFSVAAGVVSLTGSGFVTSVSGTANRITSTGGATPVIDIAATYVGQTSLTTLGTITTGVWNGTLIGPTFGGTGLNSYITGDVLYASGANTLAKLPIGINGQVLTLAAGIPSWATPTTGTVTSVSGTANRITSTGGATPVIDIAATYVGQSSITTLGTITTGVWNGSLIPLAFGGTNANLTANVGGIFYSTSTAGAILSGTATAKQMLQSGASAAPAWSTTTWPATTTSQQLLYSTSANVIGELTTANSKLPATNSAGVLAMRALSVVRQVFTGSGTYTPTTGMLYCEVEVQGGGGGSGGTPATSGAQYGISGAGGGGGYSKKIISAATIGASQSVTVGAAGLAGTAGANAGGTGGTSSLGALISATGGVGGTAGLATAAAATNGSLGGVGSSGDVNINGGPGGTGIAIFNSFSLPGQGGQSFYGAGGRGVQFAASTAGLGFGGGASGNSIGASIGALAGSAGAPGIVIVTEYVIN